MRKLDGAAVAEKFGDGCRLKLKATTGEEVFMDLSSDAAAELAAQLRPAPRSPASKSRADASA